MQKTLSLNFYDLYKRNLRITAIVDKMTAKTCLQIDSDKNI